MRLRILHFNDVHSRFEELAKVATAVEELRDENTLVFDIGDNADFARLETEGTNGVISSAILNEMGVDARVFGNNEGFAGKKNGRIISEHSICPVVTCNMYDLKGGKLEWLDDAVLLDVSGLRILVVGVTAPYREFYSLFGILVKNPGEEIQRVLRENEGNPHDVLILLSHLGVKRDREIASCFPEIDVILGGHSHTVIKKPFVENKTIICQAGAFGEHLGELTIDFSARSKKIRRFDGNAKSVKEYAPSPRILSLISRYSREADRNMSRNLYCIDVSLAHSLTEENALSNLLADCLKDFLKAEIGIINSGVLHGGITNGVVTKKLLHSICPSPLNPTRMKVKGSDILAALEKSLLREYQVANGGGPGSRAKFLGNLQVSHNVQVRLKEGESSRRISSVTVDGEPLQRDRFYVVGTSDFLQRGTGYSDLANNREETYRVEFLRDVLELYLRRKSFLNQALKRRFVPDQGQV